MGGQEQVQLQLQMSSCESECSLALLSSRSLEMTNLPIPSHLELWTQGGSLSSHLGSLHFWATSRLRILNTTLR